MKRVREERSAALFQPAVQQLAEWPDEWPEKMPPKRPRRAKGDGERPAKYYDDNLPPGDVYSIEFVIRRGGPWWRRLLLWWPDRIRMASVDHLSFGRQVGP
jgi:hypothetical protein